MFRFANLAVKISGRNINHVHHVGNQSKSLRKYHFKNQYLTFEFPDYVFKGNVIMDSSDAFRKIVLKYIH